MNIAVLLGGDSSEYQVSEKSGSEIHKHLKLAGHSAFKIRVKNNTWTCLFEDGREQDVSLKDFSVSPSKAKKIAFDFAFIIIHGTPGEDGKLQALLDIHGIPYNTSGVLSSALSFNKFACKTYLKSFDILTPESFLYRKGKTIDLQTIINQTGLPVFVKPNNGGSSFATTKVSKEEDLTAAIEEALKFDEEVIIESYVKGIELSCGLLKTKEEEIVFPVTEIVAKNEFFDYESKYTEGMTPARIDKDIQQKCQKIASDIYDHLNCKGIVRADFILRGNQLYFLELNSVPGMSKESIVPKQIRAMNYQENEILEKIIRDCI